MNTEYVEHFKALVGILETYGGAFGQEPGLVATQLVLQGVKPEDVDAASQDEIKKAKKGMPQMPPLMHDSLQSQQQPILPA